jgi:hypothetical protein
MLTTRSIREEVPRLRMSIEAPRNYLQQLLAPIKLRGRGRNWCFPGPSESWSHGGQRKGTPLLGKMQGRPQGTERARRRHPSLLSLL